MKTAGVSVEIHPVGVPGQVRYEVRQLGPEVLSEAELVRVLRAAADNIEEAGSGLPWGSLAWGGHYQPDDQQ